MATWREEEGSSNVAKMGEEFGGSSMGPSSLVVVGALFALVVVVGWEAWASHGSVLAPIWVETENGVKGLWMKFREGERVEERKWFVRIC